MLKYKSTRLATAVGGVLMLAGCISNPPYAVTKDDKTASVKLFNMSDAVMCKRDQFFSITAPEGANHAVIPAGERISLATHMQYSGYNVTYNCHPALSFVPQEGEKYVLHNYLRGGKCVIEVVREDSTTPTGVAFEDSLGPRNCAKPG